MFSPDGRWIVTGSLDATACIWETDSGRLVQECPTQGKQVLGLAMHPEGTHFATISKGFEVQIWELPSGCPITEIFQIRSVDLLRWDHADDAVVYFDPAGMLRRRDVQGSPHAKTAWLPGLAACLAGFEARDDGIIGRASPDYIIKLRKLFDTESSEAAPLLRRLFQTTVAEASRTPTPLNDPTVHATIRNQ
jgi:WD40 repeat protein